MSFCSSSCEWCTTRPTRPIVDAASSASSLPSLSAPSGPRTRRKKGTAKGTKDNRTLTSTHRKAQSHGNAKYDRAPSSTVARTNRECGQLLPHHLPDTAAPHTTSSRDSSTGHALCRKRQLTISGVSTSPMLVSRRGTSTRPQLPAGMLIDSFLYSTSTFRYLRAQHATASPVSGVDATGHNSMGSTTSSSRAGASPLAEHASVLQRVHQLLLWHFVCEGHDAWGGLVLPQSPAVERPCVTPKGSKHLSRDHKSSKRVPNHHSSTRAHVRKPRPRTDLVRRVMIASQGGEHSQERDAVPRVPVPNKTNVQGTSMPYYRFSSSCTHPR